MVKKVKKAVEPYKDVKELNWEETEKAAEIIRSDGLSETYKPFEGKNIGIYEWSVDQMLRHLLDQVDPELKQGNPVWHWALCDDHCTFVFRNGQKVTVKI